MITDLEFNELRQELESVKRIMEHNEELDFAFAQFKHQPSAEHYNSAIRAMLSWQDYISAADDL